MDEVDLLGHKVQCELGDVRPGIVPMQKPSITDLLRPLPPEMLQKGDQDIVAVD